MKKIKTASLLIAALLAIIMPFASVIGAAITLPPQYTNTFVGALDDKYDRLHSVEGEKIVIIGGSSVAFGIDSEMIEKYTGKPVVNFGLYAALGTKVMLDLSRSAIGEGDIVVLAPELDAQTLSMYFSSEHTLTAIDDKFSMFFDMGIDNQLSMLGGMWKFAVNKLDLYINGSAPNPVGVYNASSFNEYGDIEYDRPSNIMSMYFDANTPINLTPDIVESEFIEYLNDYIAFCESRGARVVFTYCPMNEMALTVERGDASIDEFCDFLEENINCNFISDIDSCIMEANYFYDTNFHLNDAGVAKRTAQLTNDLLFELEIPKYVTEELPEPPPLPEVDVKFFGEDENAIYFTYTENPNGSYTVSGLSEEGKLARELVIPLGYNGYKVTGIAANAFSEGIVEKITVTADTNVSIFYNGAFDGASTVRELWIMYTDAEAIAPPADFSGANESFRIYVPRNTAYTSGYNWSNVPRIMELVVFVEEG